MERNYQCLLTIINCLNFEFIKTKEVLDIVVSSEGMNNINIFLILSLVLQVRKSAKKNELEQFCVCFEFLKEEDVNGSVAWRFFNDKIRILYYHNCKV